MAYRPYPDPDRARHQLDRGVHRPPGNPYLYGLPMADFAQGCRDAADSIDRQFLAMPRLMTRLPEETGADAYEECHRLVDAAHWGIHGLRPPLPPRLSVLAQGLRPAAPGLNDIAAPLTSGAASLSATPRVSIPSPLPPATPRATCPAQPGPPGTTPPGPW